MGVCQCPNFFDFWIFHRAGRGGVPSKFAANACLMRAGPRTYQWVHETLEGKHWRSGKFLLSIRKLQKDVPAFSQPWFAWELVRCKVEHLSILCPVVLQQQLHLSFTTERDVCYFD